jgi:tetratricopeptide (TPR) repeat protein
VDLHRQLSSGAQEINLSDVLTQLEAPTTDAINEMLVEAVEDFNQRNFLVAKEKVEKVLLELPGHAEARELLAQLGESLKVEHQVGKFLAQAHEALNQGDPQEAANFVTMAQALDPHHSGIAPTLQEIYDKGGVSQPTPPPGPGAGPGEPLFEAAEGPEEDFSLKFDEAEEPASAAQSEPDFAAGGFPLTESMEPQDFEFPGVGESPSGQQQPDVGTEAFTEAVGEGFDQPAGGTSPADDVSDLFEAGPDIADEQPVDEDSPLGLFMRRGETAFEAGDFMAAIDAWSRIYLIDPANTEVASRIEEAKGHLEVSSRNIEHLLFDAQDAQISGENYKALALVNQILEIDPHHPEALDLMQRLSGVPASDGSSEDAMPELDDDLFQEPIAEPAEAEVSAPEEADWQAAPAEARPLLALSSRTLALAGVAVVAVLVIGWLGLRALVGGGGDGRAIDVYELRSQAEELFRGGEIEEALRLVEAYEPADAAEEKVLSVLITKYKRANATPTPTPVPASFVTAREMLNQGLWYRAYSEGQAGLKSYPDDEGLLQLVATVESVEPRATTLYELIENASYQAAIGTIHDLMEKHPGQADLEEALGRTLFNAALVELRSYNLTGAESHLRELAVLEPDDGEVQRVLEFIANYKARPVDMQLRVFIQSLAERREWSKLGAEGTPPAETEPTPTPTDSSA